MQLQFDASQVAPMQPLTPIPAGWYTAIVTSAEMKPTSKGDGSAYLELIQQVTEGEHAGRKLFERLNLANANPQAVDMAYQQLSAIMRAAGVIRMSDTSELFGHPMKVKVKIRPGSVNPTTGAQYNAQNEIEEYASLSGIPLTQIGGTPGGAPAAQPWQQQAAAPLAASAPAAFNPQQGGAPQQGFAPSPSGGQPAWAQGAPIQPAAPQAAPVAPSPAMPIKRMTPKAGAYTYEQMVAGGWTDAALVQEGYLEIVQPQMAAPPAPAAMPPAPQAQFAPQQVAQVPQPAPAAQPWQAPGQAQGAPGMPNPAIPQQGAGTPPPWAR